MLEYLRSDAAQLAAFGVQLSQGRFLLCGRPARPPSRLRWRQGRGVGEGLRAVPEGIGPKAFLLGCGCPLGPAAGLVDALRVSPDTGSHWALRHEQVAAGFDEAAPCLFDALRTTLLRAPLHRRLWINDPDCLLLQSSRTGLSSWERQLAADVIAGTGDFLMLSEDLALYGPEDWAQVRRTQQHQAQADTPLEIEAPFSSQLVVRSAATALAVEISPDPVPGRWRLTEVERPATA